MKKIQRLLLAILATTAAFFQSCDQTRVIAGGSDDTHSSLDIQGRVLTKDAAPLPNVIVRLRHLGLSDTTGSDGKFALDGMSGTTLTQTDTLDYYREGEQISSVAVPSSVWMAPDLYVVQRDFSGTVSGSTSTISRIQGTVAFPDGTTRTVEMDWNRLQNRYSGYAYFVSMARVDTFSVQIQAQDSADRSTGRSVPVVFTSRAGSVVIPDFDARNVLPSLAMAVYSAYTSIAAGKLDIAETPTETRLAWVGDSLLVVAQSEGRLERVQSAGWSLDRINWQSRTGRRVPTLNHLRWDTAFSVKAPKKEADTITVWFRMTLVDGIQVLDSVRISPRTFPVHAEIAVDFDHADPSLDGALPGQQIRLALSETLPPFAKAVARKVLLGFSGSPQIVHTSHGDSVSEPFLGIGPSLDIQGTDTIVSAPTKIGKYAYLYHVDFSDGTYFEAVSRSFQVLGTAPRIRSLSIEADSISIEWSDSVKSQEATNLYAQWNPQSTGSTIDSIMVSAGTTKAALHTPPGAGSVMVRIRHPSSIASDTTIPIAGYTRTFSGSMADPSRLMAWPEGIGGFRANVEGAIGQILIGEVAKLRWYREDSTSKDGAAILIRAPAYIAAQWEPSLAADTLSMDLASPSSLDLQVVATIRCDDVSWQTPPDTLRWALPAGAAGHIDLPVADGGWPLPRVANQGWTTNECKTQDFRIIATQTTGPRARQGFLEVDNVRWH